MSNPKCFISYSHENNAHKKWVRNLAKQLQTNGVEVLLDQWDLSPGSDAPLYMESSVRNSNFVILVCTPDFTKKANAGIGGVGYEKCIVTGEVFQCVSAPEKFIPIIRKGNIKEAIPSYLLHKIYIDFRDDDDFQTNLQQLLRACHNAPQYSRPQLGPKPVFSNKMRASSKDADKITYCSNCGAFPGERSECTTITGYHDFVSKKGTVYCNNCGVIPGDSSECTTITGFHDFVSGKGTIYCENCGEIPGEVSQCTTITGFHNFVSIKGKIYCRNCGQVPGERSECTTITGFHDFVSDN